MTAARHAAVVACVAACGASSPPSPSSAAPATRCWVHALDGGAVEALAIGVDGGVAAIGTIAARTRVVTSGAPGGGRDLVVASWSATGSPRWATRFGGRGDDLAGALAIVRGGDVVVTGSTLDAGYRCTVRRLDARDGSARWQLALDGNGDALCRAIAYDASDDSVIVAGSFHGHLAIGGVALVSRGEADLFVARLAAGDGRVIWVRRLGGDGDEVVRAVAIAPDRRVIVGGQFQRTIAIGGDTVTAAGDYDGLVVALTPAGDPIWARGLGGVGFDVVKSIAIDPSGAIAVSGAWMRPGDYGDRPPILAGVMDGMLAMYSRDGVAGTRLLVTAGSSQVHHLARAGDGTLWAIGHFTGTLSLAGASLASRPVSADDRGNAAYLASFSPAGAPLTAVRIGAPGARFAYAVATGPGDELAIGASLDGDAAVCGGTIDANAADGAFVARLR